VPLCCCTNLLCIVSCIGFDDVRLVYDRETGKPKGYGFCEYQDLETAQSAMRNLNNHDFNGRPLRVGVAAGEQTKDENRGMQQALGGPVAEVTMQPASSCIDYNVLHIPFHKQPKTILSVGPFQ